MDMGTGHRPRQVGEINLPSENTRGIIEGIEDEKAVVVVSNSFRRG